jgi:hypothetical protein
MGTPNKQLKTGAELESLLEQLEDPFDPSEIKWRVTHTTRDGSRGAVVAFADQRAYTDRLNRVFTPSGWTRTYDVSEVTSLSRIRKEKVIQTGKILVTCALTIGALGTVESSSWWSRISNWTHALPCWRRTSRRSGSFA